MHFVRSIRYDGYGYETSNPRVWRIGASEGTLSMADQYTYEYPRPMVTVDALVFSGEDDGRQVALIRRKHEPFADCWALPGGFVDMDETLEHAVARELEEETGLTGIALRQMRSFGDPGRDPRGRAVTVVYCGVAPVPLPLHAADDAADAAWFPLDALPPLAFDHDKIIAFARALR